MLILSFFKGEMMNIEITKKALEFLKSQGEDEIIVHMLAVFA